MQLWIC